MERKTALRDQDILNALTDALHEARSEHSGRTSASQESIAYAIRAFGARAGINTDYISGLQDYQTSRSLPPTWALETD